MATVTGYTAQRMLEIENTTVVDGTIVGDHLILLTREGTEIDAGVVAGMAGPTGATGPPGASSFAGYEEPVNNLGNVAGATPLNLNLHNVFLFNPTAAVTISFTNLPAAGVGQPITIIVVNSTYAITWPVGTKFPDGTPPVLSGLTFLSGYAFGTQVYIGTAWSAVA